MSDRIQATDSTSTLTLAQQNQLSSETIASNFLKDVSLSLSQPDSLAGLKAADDSYGYIGGLVKDPIQKQVLNQIATDMSDNTLMNSLGLQGSIKRDGQGNITEFDFSNPKTEASYQNTLVNLEKKGMTPTQADAQFEADNIFTANQARGDVKYDSQNKS